MSTQSRRADRYSPLVTILLVDTNPAVVRLLALQLRERGFRVLEATSFPDAQRKWDAEEPQVLVADVRLDEFNGLHLLIRARAVRPEVTAIITSPVSDQALADETKRLGGTFLVKPVDVGDIVAAIEHRVPALAPTSRVSLATLIYREFRDDEGAPAIAKRQVPPSKPRVAARSAHGDSTLVRAGRAARR